MNASAFQNRCTFQWATFILQILYNQAYFKISVFTPTIRSCWHFLIPTGKPCPNPGCQGKLTLLSCRGHCGYPVTHFWRHVNNSVFFQAKGYHDHPRPEVKSLSDKGRHAFSKQLRQDGVSVLRTNLWAWLAAGLLVVLIASCLNVRCLLVWLFRLKEGIGWLFNVHSVWLAACLVS